MYKIHFLVIYIGLLISCDSISSSTENICFSNTKFAQFDSIPKSNHDQKSKLQIKLKGKIYTIKEVDQKPRFPGCENIIGDINTKKQCADKKMLEFIYKHAKYPNIIRESGVEGVVVIRFVVDKYGIIRIPKIIRDIGGGCGDNALKMVKMMNNLPQRWTPGKKNGQPVNVQFNLPVRYRVDG